MDRASDFLIAAVGDDAAAALRKASAKSPALGSVLLPRVVLSWLNVFSGCGYEGEIPGVPGSTLQFAKSESGDYAGTLSIADELYDFVGASITQLAATVTVSLGGTVPIAKGIRDSDLLGLGKSVDFLVKSRILKLLKAGDEGLSGQQAAPRGPAAPEAPEGQKKGGAGTQPKLPSQVKMRITKHQSDSICSVCEAKSFQDGQFVGCYCMRSLSKNVSSIPCGDGYELAFGEDWTKNNIRVLMDILGASNE